MPIPASCPECGHTDLSVSQVPPSAHDRGDEWETRLRCPACEYVELAEQ